MHEDETEMVYSAPGDNLGEKCERKIACSMIVSDLWKDPIVVDLSHHNSPGKALSS